VVSLGCFWVASSGCFWVAQRFQRCDKCIALSTALAAEERVAQTDPLRDFEDPIHNRSTEIALYL